MKNKNLFVVEFGKPGNTLWMPTHTLQPPLYVVASDYNEAAEKALAHIQMNHPGHSVIDYDGSLNINTTELKVKAVSLAAEFVIW